MSQDSWKMHLKHLERCSTRNEVRHSTCFAWLLTAFCGRDLISLHPSKATLGFLGAFGMRLYCLHPIF